MSTSGIAGELIRSFVERVEHIDEELKSLSESKKDIFSEAKGQGLDVAILREVIKRRKIDRDKLDESESLLDLYEQALAEAA